MSARARVRALRFEVDVCTRSVEHERAADFASIGCKKTTFMDERAAGATIESVCEVEMSTAQVSGGLQGYGTISTPPAMRGHPRRLVDDQQGVVLVQGVQAIRVHCVRA